MTEKSAKPQLRFAGFDDTWEQRKALDIADYSKGNGYSKSDLTEIGTPIILYGRLYTKYQFAIDEVDTFATPKDGSVYSQGNEVIIPASGETAEDIARASAVEKSGILLGGDLNILRPFNFVNPLFLALTISNGQPQKELAKKAQGKSVVHIHNSDIQEVSVSFPTRAEQDRIVAVFRNLDNLITLHQRKYDKLTNVKKSMLEKMFPKNGSNVPEIRFKGFSDAWEQRKLGDVVKTVTDYVAAGSFADLRENVVYKDSPDYAQLVRTVDLKSGFSSSSQVYVDRHAFNFLYRVNLDEESIILPNIGNCGEVYYIRPEELPYAHNVLGPNAIMVRSNSSDNQFLSILFQGSDFQEKLKLIISPNGQTKFNKTELKLIQLILPNDKAEQKKIGELFGQLDNLITLHQRELEKLKNLKKACLEKMFV